MMAPIVQRCMVCVLCRAYRRWAVSPLRGTAWWDSGVDDTSWDDVGQEMALLAVWTIRQLVTQ